jgi:putative oxidoreductase
MNAKFQDLGLLLLRLGVGALFLFHGYPKIMSGPDGWANLGLVMKSVAGIDYFPTFWGLMCGLAEAGGGICLMLGFMFRPACLIMAINMTMALLMHLGHGDSFDIFSHALLAWFVFVGLLLIGPGAYTLSFPRKG